MHLDPGFIFSLLSALVCLGGICISFGILKGKVDHAVEENKEQADHLKTCATKEDITGVIKQVDEDRKRNSDQHQKLFDVVNSQAKDIGALKAVLDAVKGSLEELKKEIREGLKDIRHELKELRK